MEILTPVLSYHIIKQIKNSINLGLGHLHLVVYFPYSDLKKKMSYMNINNMQGEHMKTFVHLHKHPTMFKYEIRWWEM